MQSTSESIARRTQAANILTTNSAIPLCLQAAVDACLKFVTVVVEACGKQSDGGVFRNSALYQSLETRSLKLPEARFAT
jgi:hypothetical protein